jgi:antitoxin component of MazEF toxin-antitoxin module
MAIEHSTTTISRQGNSLGVRLSKNVLETAGFDSGQKVDLSAERGRVTITANSGSDQRYREAFERCKIRYHQTLKALAK